MHRLDLPPRVASALEKAAEHAGVQPEQLAIVLLNLAMALRDPAAQSPFAQAVRQYLGERSISPEQVSAVVAELVGLCLQQEGGGLAAWNEGYLNLPYELATGAGVLMVKESPMYAYGAPAPSPAPLARASAMGRYAHLRSGSEEFARAKAAEIAREDRVRP
jgi:hemoglobin-like flavoprotein